MAQRTEALQKNLVQEMVKFYKSAIQPQFHRIHKDLAARDKDIKREFQSVNERFDRVDARFHTLEMDMKGGFNSVNKQFTHMENRFDRVETKVEGLEARMSSVEAKVGSKLRNLIEYYQLQEEATQATADYDDSFAGTKLKYTAQELERAISSNAWGAVVVLGGRIGIDCDALHDRVIQVQFHSQKNVSSKRDASDMSTSKRAAKTHCPLSDRVRPVSGAQQDTDVREPSVVSRIYSEVDSEKFKHPSLRLSQNMT
ncbi:hypothetical protein BDV32DRAFT_156898 [Aspergillus pseudonomiae]|nr:hypothetical protein BDV32DRAFT_156898 [Aspergillus pseudonomiae]